MVLLDTCALLWWTLDPTSLSRKAADICARIESEGAFVSSISFWEIGMKWKKKKLHLPLSLESFVASVKETGVVVLPVDEDIWVRNALLDWDHRDPVDRTMVVTAEKHQLPIITEEAAIRKFYKKSIW